MKPTLAGATCEQRYDAAVEICRELRTFCTNTLVCKQLRTQCPQSTSDYSSCESLNECARIKTPTIFRTVCRYGWSGEVNAGNCINKNTMEEIVANACPGRSITLSTDNDPTFTCLGQVDRFKEHKQVCQAAIRNYQANCANDESRQEIAVKQCPSGLDPVAVNDDTVTAEDRSSVDIGRPSSATTTAYKSSTPYSSSKARGGSSTLAQ